MLCHSDLADLRHQAEGARLCPEHPPARPARQVHPPLQDPAVRYARKLPMNQDVIELQTFSFE